MGHTPQKNLFDKPLPLGAHDNERYVPGLQDFQNSREGLARIKARFQLCQPGLLKPLAPAFQGLPGGIFGPLPVAGRIGFMERHVQGVQHGHPVGSLGGQKLYVGTGPVGNPGKIRGEQDVAEQLVSDEAG